MNLTPTSLIVINAPHARTYGAEIGTKWLPVPELELFGNISLLKTEILDGGEAGDITGNDLPRAPIFTLDVGGNYRHWSGVEPVMLFTADDSGVIQHR